MLIVMNMDTSLFETAEEDSQMFILSVTSVFVYNLM